jgi:MFS family permease
LFNTGGLIALRKETNGLKSISLQRLRLFPLWQPLSARGFRLFWIGQSISLFGDQFYRIALPWLVLVLTGSNFALSSVLLVSGAVRAVFQLLGGALSDRFSPRALMMISNATGAIVTALTAVVVFLNVAQPWHLYILAAIFGLIDAMFYPAYMSATPMLLMKEHLVAGNALLRSTVRLMGIIGPATAGFVVARLGYSAAFALDSATFIFAAFMLWIMRMAPRSDEQEPSPTPQPEEASPKKGLVVSIVEGFRYAWSSTPLRMLFLFMAFFEFAIAGSMQVGLPVLANQQYGTEKGPEMNGWMASSLAAGILIGMVLSGSFDTTKLRGKLTIGLSLMMGFSFILLGFSIRLVTVCPLLLIIGIGGGALGIILQAWIQMNTEKRMMGRVMSLLMLGILIVEMLSYALAGVLTGINLHFVFIISGVMLMIAAVIAFTSRTLNADG